MKLEAKQRLLAAGELSPKQKAIDFNDNGKVDGEDLKQLREGKKPVEAAGKPAWARDVLRYFSLQKLHQSTDDTKLVFFSASVSYALGLGLTKLGSLMKQHELQISFTPESARSILVTVEPLSEDTKQFMK